MAEAEYAAAFGGGQVLVELELTLTNLGQQSPPLLFVDNESAIGLATSSVRPKKCKSIDIYLDWIKVRAGQIVFRLAFFLPGSINPADFFTKILPVYRTIALPFLHGTPYHYHPQPPHPFPHILLPITQPHHNRSSRRDRDPPTLASPLPYRIFSS